MPIYVVSLIEDQTYNSITDYRTVYSFGFPRYHLLGRGFLGFDEVNKFDPQNGLTDIQAFSINTNYYFPFLTSHLIQTSNHTIISSDENLFEFRTLGQATFFPYIATNLHKKRDLNNSFISTQKSSFDYDDHGNLTFKEILYDPNDLNINSANSDYDFSDKLLTSYNLFDNIIWLPILVEEIYKLTGEDEIDKKQSFEYFPLGNPHFPLVKQIQINIVPPNNPLCLQTTYDYDDYGNIIYIKKSAPFALDPKPLDRVTTFEYNSDYQSRFPTKKTLDPDGINLEFYSQFDPIFGLISSSIDCNQLSHKFYYDAFGNLWKEEFPDGSIFQTVSRWASGNSYAPSGALYYRWSKNTGQGEEITFFDKFANEVRDVSRSLNYSVIYSDYEYDSFRRLSKSSLPYFPGSTIYYTEYSYDILDRIVQKIYPNTSQESTVYNGNETLTTISSTTLPSQTSIKIINPMGWTVRSVDADQIEIIFEYTSNGLVKNTYISGNTSTSITQEYDVNDNCVTLVDPNTKEINFTYNAFNELVSKIDNIGHHSISTYDALGRIIRLDEVEGLTHWYYDNSTKQKALGKIDRILNSNESREFFYDELGRIEFVDEQINGDPEVSEFMRKYDSYSRIKEYLYPTNILIRNIYSTSGKLSAIKLGHKMQNINTNLWSSSSTNPYNQIMEAQLGNNIQVSYGYFNSTGLPSSIYSLSNSTSILQNNEYQWNDYGNMVTRMITSYTSGTAVDNVEDFTYDLLNRLTSVSYNGQIIDQFLYDNLGNITYKPPLYEIKYGENGTGPHAMTSALFTDYQPFNITQQITYTSFNKISQVNEGEVQANFSYGIDHQRVKQIITTNQEISQEKIYYGDDYEKIINDNGTKGIHYISSPKGICAAIEINQDNEISIKYILTDNLGSFQVVTDQNGNLLEELSFDSWGRRRNPSTWSREDVPTEFIFDRGFTGHEHMDVFRLINMNGRIYDPITGRYLSPDPLIQSPDFSQSLNRYSYCMNNPLTFKDPNGEFVWVAAIVAAVVGAVIDYGVQVAVNYACGKSDADAWFNDIDFFDILTTGVISGLTFGYGGAASAGNSIGKFGTYILNNKVAVGVTQTVLTSAIDITGNGVQPVSFSNFGTRVGIGLGFIGVSTYASKLFHWNKASDVITKTDELLDATTEGTTAITNYFPRNGGALGDWKTEYLMPGDEIDRFGSEFGKHFSPRGTPLDMRALPPTNTRTYNAYRVAKPFSVQSSTIAPAFNKLGLGTQYLSPVKANILEKRGIIIPLH